MTAPRIRAPKLTGRSWLNTGGKEIHLADLRGKFTLLDFWTFCCINCLHVLDELRPLEDEFADVLSIIGVHSPKFAHEAELPAIKAAVERYGVHHPVLDDPRLETWQQYAVKAWPTLVLIDPEGYIVHVAAGEGHFEALRAILGQLVAEHEAKGTLNRGSGPYVPPVVEETTLRFPSKAVVTAAGTLLVADAAHHSVAELAADGVTVIRRIGSGERGLADGKADEASFSEPAGIAVLPTEIADQVGYDYLIADTVNHLLRSFNSVTGQVGTVAGTGLQWRDGKTDGSGLEVDLTSPWDAVWYTAASAVIVANAGNHTLQAFDPVSGRSWRFAGTTVEGLSDGPALAAFFAQPSGLAVQGEKLWIADSETSAVRWIEPGDGGFVITTAIGKGLFDFGHRDGDAEQALLQHPLGVAVLPDGSIGIADTYNGAIRRYDPETRQVSTLASDVAEPSGLVVMDGEVVVVASAGHQLERPVPPGLAAELVHGQAHQVQRPPTELGSGEVRLAVIFTPPPGQKLDDRYGPSTRLEVTSSPPDLLVGGVGDGTDLVRTITIADGFTHGVLHVVAQAASCDVDAEHPVCRLTRQDWGVPVRISADGPGKLDLMLGGMAAQ